MIAINNLSIVMIFSSLISFSLFIYAFKRRQNLAILDFSLLLLSATIWSMFYGIELSFTTLELMNFAVFFEYLGITTLPVFWFLFATRYSGNEKWLSPIKSIFLFVIPVISFLAAATNNLHFLFYTSSEITNTFGYFHRALEHGIFWWIHVIYSHILVLSGTALIATMLFKQSHISRVRVTFLLLGATIPYAMNSAYILGIMPFGFLDLTPIAFIFMGIVLTLGVFMVKLFDITPLALDKLFDNIPDAIFVLDTNNKLLNANPSAKKLIKKFSHPSDKNPDHSVACMITDFLCEHDADTCFVFESSYYEITCSEILSGTKNKIGDLIILRDITDRKNTEIEHLNSEKNYRLIAENSSDVIWTMDLYGNYHYVSPSVFHMLGYTAEENIKQPITENLTPESLKVAVGLINYAILNIKNHMVIEPHTVELQQRHKNGSIIWTEVVISPIYDQDEEFKYFLGVTRNISNRKQIELDLTAAKERAEESDRLKSAFLANMSHEIRTPMNGILGFLELLKIMKLSDEDKFSYIRIIEESGHRLLDTINDIIEISKIESGQLPLQIVDVNIETLVNSHYHFFKHQTDDKGIQLINKCAINRDEAFIQTDKTKLDGILTNLIRNAIKFTINGAIEIGNQIKDNELIFYIKDSGIGIPSEKIKIIFDRFVQADINDTRCFEGSGLGLSIVKGYLQMLGGEIWVESTVDVGSTFYFKIPYVPAILKPQAIQSINSEIKIDIDFSDTKILLAEDDNISGFLIKEILNYHKIKLIHVKNGIDCLNTFTQHKDITLVLMDIKMPFMDGHETAKKIRGMNSHIPIVALTAYAMESDRKKAFEAGCTDFIPKPIDSRLLLETIAKWAVTVKI